MQYVAGFLAALVGSAFLKYAGRLLAIGAGVTVLSFTGAQQWFDGIRSFVETRLSQLPGEVPAILGMLKVDLYINWVFLGFGIAISIRLVSRFVSGAGR